MSLPDAIDLSHHLSQSSRKRGVSPLKGLQKYYGKPGLISLAGGLPSPEYFPFNVVSSEVLPKDHFPLKSSDKTTGLTWLRRILGFRNRGSTVAIPKYPKVQGDISLSTDLQYSLARGSPQLEGFTYNFSARVHKPAYKNFATMIDIGNTDGWFKAVTILCEPGQGILTSEWAYTTAIATIRPYGIEPVSVAMDGQGMRDDALRCVLSTWDEIERGMPRPHVLYIVPIGQNPTGVTMGLERKKAIYDVCVEFDVIIVEDDPYYFLQEGEYLPPQERSRKQEDHDDNDVEHFLSQLAPSFLRVDYQGRVIRLDSFSKTFAPGSRLGWCTCNPLFAERIERQSEISTQAPCGFSQSIIASLLLNWKFDGYIRWLRGVREQYTHRRDFFVDCLAERFDLIPSTSTEGIWSGSKVYIAYRTCNSPSNVKSTKLSSETQPLFSFVPPTSGMFTWLQMHFEHHPLFPSHGSKALETKLWIALAEAGLLFGPGSMFASEGKVQLGSDVGHFRISFSNAELVDLEKAVDIFASVLQTFHEA